MTPTNGNQTVRTTKGGISLDDFSDVKLYKDVPAIAPPATVKDALEYLGNDHAKLLKIIHSGLQADAVTTARENESGWLKFDEDGKPTSESFSGSLVSGEILNPVVLNLSRINPVEVVRNGKTVEITWDDAQSPEEKRAVKAATIDMIRTTPRIVEGLKKKMAAAVAAGE